MQIFFYTIQREIDTEKGDPKDIKFICMGMSVPFQAGTKKEFPKAQIISYKFHVIKVCKSPNKFATQSCLYRRLIVLQG